MKRYYVRSYNDLFTQAETLIHATIPCNNSHCLIWLSFQNRKHFTMYFCSVGRLFGHTDAVQFVTSSNYIKFQAFWKWQIRVFFIVLAKFPWLNILQVTHYIIIHEAVNWGTCILDENKIFTMAQLFLYAYCNIV